MIKWHRALAALALCNAAICVPIHLWVLRGSGSRRLPETGPLRPQEAAPSLQGSASRGGHSAGEARHARQSEEGGAVRRALRSRVFWALALCFTFYYTAFSALSFHLIPLLSDRAVPMTTIIAAVALIGPAQVLGREQLDGLGHLGDGRR